MLLQYSVAMLKTKATNFRNGFSLAATGCGVSLRNRSFSHQPQRKDLLNVLVMCSLGCRTWLATP
jgi:hypothetical protein